MRPYGETPRPCSETLSSDPRRYRCSLAVATHHAPAISLTIPAKLRHAGAPLGRRPIYTDRRSSEMRKGDFARGYAAASRT